MPLRAGPGPKVRSENIGELRQAGYPEKQAVAIAYSKQRKGRAHRAARHLDKQGKAK